MTDDQLRRASITPQPAAGDLGRRLPAATVVAAIFAIRDNVRGDPTGFAVGMAIASNVDDTGTATIGLRGLAEQSGFHTATIGRAVTRLAALGVLEVVLVGGVNRYRITRSSCPQVRAQDARLRAQDAHDEVRAEDAQLRAPDARLRAQSAHSAPVVVPPISRVVGDEKTTTTRPEQTAVARAALDLLDRYVTDETNNRAGIRNRNAYRASIVRRVCAELAVLEATGITDPAELAARVDPTLLEPVGPAVAERLAAAGADMARTAPADDELATEETYTIDADRARAAYLAGLADVSRETP